MDGKYQRYGEDFGCSFKGFRVLIVTTSQERIANMRKAARDTYIDPPQIKRFIWLTTDDMLNEENIFEPVWQSVDISDGSQYHIG